MTTAAEARRIALAAQGFGVARSDEPSKGPSLARILAEVRRLGVLQIDSVNVLARAHYLPLFARLGAYDRGRLDELAWGSKRALFEYWSHQASLTPVELYPIAAGVEGWKRGAFVHRDFASAPRLESKQEVAALVGPFDPIVWYRARAHRLFDFHYRIGIYTPAHQRTHGYYVMPFLRNDALVARVDLKADRAESVLRVRAAWLEEGQSPEVAEPLAAELGRMARWLGLARISVERKGTLANTLRARVRG